MASPDSFLDWMRAVEIVFKVAAVLAAATWTWILFVKKRQRFPRAKTRHSIQSRLLNSDLRLVRLSVEVENAGEVLVKVSRSEAWIQGVLPVAPEIEALLGRKERLEDLYAGNEIKWPVLDDHEMTLEEPNEIEPGEQDTFEFDFIIDSNVETVLIYSHLRNTFKSKEIGWNRTTMHDLPGETAVKD